MHGVTQKGHLTLWRTFTRPLIICHVSLESLSDSTIKMWSAKAIAKMTIGMKKEWRREREERERRGEREVGEQRRKKRDNGRGRGKESR